MKQLIKKLENHINLYRDSLTGLAFVENGKTGSIHSAHPNIDISGSVKGMKKLGYWKEKDKIIKTNNFYYNVSHCRIDDELDEIARQNCQCDGNH